MYYDLLPKIKNALQAGKDNLSVRFSTMDMSIAKALAERGYIKDVQRKNVGHKSFLDIRLSRKNGKSIFTDFRIYSKPSRRLYVGHQDLKHVKYGHGIGILSTSRGIVNHLEARKQKIGGEYLFEVW